MERLTQVMQVLEAVHRSYLLPGVVQACFPYIWSHLQERMVNLRSFIGHQPGRLRLLRFLGLLLRLLELMQIGRLREQWNGVDGQFDVLEARWPLILLQKILLPNACFYFSKGWRKLRISARVRWTVRRRISFLLKRIEVRDRLVECLLVLCLVRRCLRERLHLDRLALSTLSSLMFSLNQNINTSSHFFLLFAKRSKEFLVLLDEL